MLQSSRVAAHYKQQLSEKDSIIADLTRHLESSGVNHRKSRRHTDSESSGSDTNQVQHLQQEVSIPRLSVVSALKIRLCPKCGVDSHKEDYNMVCQSLLKIIGADDI